MKTWVKAIRDGAITGCITSIATTIVLAQRGKTENGTPYAPVNAISHWYWGDHAANRNEPSMGYTVPGYAIHHASVTFWSTLYEKWFGEHTDQKAIVPAVTGAAAIASLACFTDYKLTPRRFRPGYEMRLSCRSLFLVYGAFGAALMLRGLASARRSQCRPD